MLAQLCVPAGYVIDVAYIGIKMDSHSFLPAKISLGKDKSM